MLRSMTGFGSAEADVGGRKLFIDVKAVNHRFFNVFTKLPSNIQTFESRIQALLKKRLTRGQVSVFVAWDKQNGGKPQVAVNMEAARQAVDVALTGAEDVLRGRRVAYALCRPPGHHAERRSFGGFCYFSNAAIAAQFLSRHGSVAMLDVDYHHGNGAQDIFYNRRDVLTVSLHGHPNHSYPYFSGFADEQGAGPGKGFNYNFPLPEGTDETLYLQTLDKAVKHIERFKATFLIVCLGFDTMKGDPTGSFVLRAASLRQIGRRIGQLRLPTLVVQEGGYSLRNLRQGVVSFFTGLSEALAGEFAEVKK